jgi:DNA-binding NtrC family response regulator
MLTGVGDVKIAVECMKAGAYDFLTKPYSTEELLTTVERALERKKLLRENLLMKSELSRLVGSSDLVGRSKALEKVMGVAAKVAPTESTVLIQGASGTGKELVASFIYKNSSRKEGPFVAVNCASIPDTLIESELFGHEKGAFTDARAMKQGLVEVANGGTLFLDEIGDISLTVQPKLLRFIQTGEFRRVGGTNVLKSEVRILSATNKDLQEEVHRGRFREDLLYRINVITLGLPTLKQRPEDIPLLVENFLKNKLRTKVQKQISPKAVEVLRKYDWPGNVRELENVIERAAILCRDDMIRPEDLSLPLRATMLSETLEEQGLVGSLVSMKDIEHKHIEGVLRNVAGNKTEAAKILGISLKTLYTKIQTYQIKLD